MQDVLPQEYRVSGHESFSCRYTWLPKAVRGLSANPNLFTRDEEAMVELGVGKNMVRSIRFWSQVCGVVGSPSKGRGYEVTPFGQHLLGADGHDPFLEDIRTLWLIHWNLSTDASTPLLAWDFLLNRWHEPELVPSVVLKALHKEASRGDAKLSEATIGQHWDTFLHTYVPTRGRKGEVQEDNLDSPLTELGLIKKVGERPGGREGRAEPVYEFRREDKPEITEGLFVYALNDFWNKRHRHEDTILLRDVAHGHGSPGQIFKLPEDVIRHRIESLAGGDRELFSYSASANLEKVERRQNTPTLELLPAIYRLER